jgi:hypothetical protein
MRVLSNSRFAGMNMSYEKILLLPLKVAARLDAEAAGDAAEKIFRSACRA